jgi:hypothetical protein
LLVRTASHKAQIAHNAKVQQLKTEEVSADECGVLGEKNRKTASLKN